MSLYRTIKCANCDSHVANDGDKPEEVRTPCPYCGSRARTFDVAISETLEVQDTVHAHVVRLSKETSATAVSIMTTTLGPDLMNDLWEKSAPIRESLLKQHGNEPALRAIADGYLEFWPGFVADEYTKFLVRYNAREILLDRSRAAERQQREEDTRRSDRKTLLGLVMSFAKMVLGWFR